MMLIPLQTIKRIQQLIIVDDVDSANWFLDKSEAHPSTCSFETNNKSKMLFCISLFVCNKVRSIIVRVLLDNSVHFN